MPESWHCEAYGPEGAEIGARCFVAGELHERVCADRDVCHRTMVAQRQRVFRRMNELAASGSPWAADLAQEFASPERILGGGDEDPAP